MASRARKSKRLTTFALPFTLLFLPVCSSQPLQSACAELNMGSDADFDGLADEAERCVGSDELNPDSDGDGIPDGTEFNYPKICVADDRAAQRRPVVTCGADSECQEGEKCTGLNPTSNDSDGDGVADGLEDLNFNGEIDFSTGETDPRLWDTDGDETGDKDGGQQICRPDGLAMVVQKSVGAIQIGHDPVFGQAKTVANAASGKYGAALDDTAAGVAALVVSAPNSGATMTVTNDRIAVETAIKAALTAATATTTDVFVGRQFKTHEQYDAVTSTFRVTKAGSNASALRDAVVNTLTGGTAPGGASAGASGTFYLDVTTVRRGIFEDVIVAFSPTASYDNAALSTAIRVGDLLNASAVAESSKDLDYQCQGVLTGNAGAADILWTVDTSNSMDNNQVNLAKTAQTFFSRLQLAGVDFRVGVFTAYSPATTPTPKLSDASPGFTGGFSFIQGTDPMGVLTLCRQVTSPTSGGNGYCPDDVPKTNDPAEPFGAGSSGNDVNEEPVAAAVLINDAFKTNAAAMNPNANWQWRPGATRVAFMVTDEPGGPSGTPQNDWTRYFKDGNIPGTATRWAPGGVYNQSVLNSIVKYFSDNQILAYGMVPVFRTCAALDERDLPRCVIEASGGAYIDIINAQDVDVQAAMNRLVSAIAGSASQFKLSRTPITSTIKVSVRNQIVPRSRQDGFDYDTAARTIVFYGNTYRPKQGDQVFISYRVWKGSLG